MITAQADKNTRSDIKKKNQEVIDSSSLLPF